jgi:cold shock CspA family protein
MTPPARQQPGSSPGAGTASTQLAEHKEATMNIGSIRTRYGVEVHVDVELFDGSPSVFVHVTSSEHAPVHVLVDGQEVDVA